MFGINEKVIGWVGDPTKPEDKDNHQIGYWCYIMQHHCDPDRPDPQESCKKCRVERLLLEMAGIKLN